MGKLAFLLTLAAVLGVSAPAQQNGSGSVPNDTFLGKWKLNTAKSSAGPSAETITIEPERKQYRITVEAAYSDDRGKKIFWTVTDMNGRGSPFTYSSVQQPTDQEEWHVQRDGPDGFTINAILRGEHGQVSRFEWRYRVSLDGKALTRRRISSVPPSHETQVLVFDRIS